MKAKIGNIEFEGNAEEMMQLARWQNNVLPVLPAAERVKRKYTRRIVNARRNHKHWTHAEDRTIREYIMNNNNFTTTGRIRRRPVVALARELGRSEKAVRLRVHYQKKT